MMKTRLALAVFTLLVLMAPYRTALASCEWVWCWEVIMEVAGQSHRLTDTSIAASGVRVQCIGKHHEGSKWVTLSQAKADLNGKAFHAYYCRRCADRLEEEIPS